MPKMNHEQMTKHIEEGKGAVIFGGKIIEKVDDLPSDEQIEHSHLIRRSLRGETLPNPPAAPQKPAKPPFKAPVAVAEPAKTK